MALKTAYEAAVERTAHIPPQEPPKPYEPPPAPKTFEEWEAREHPCFEDNEDYWPRLAWEAATLAERERLALLVQPLAAYPRPPASVIGRNLTWPEFIAAFIRAGAEE